MRPWARFILVVAAFGLLAGAAPGTETSTDGSRTTEAPALDNTGPATPSTTAVPPKAPTSALSELGVGSVRVGDELVLELVAEVGGSLPGARARDANRALSEAARGPSQPVRVEQEENGYAVLVGAVVVLRLEPEDAVAADMPLPTLAAEVAVRIEEALAAERWRQRASATVLAWSMLVLSALLVFGLVRGIGRITRRGRERLSRRTGPFPALRFGFVEVVNPAAVRAFALVAVNLIGVLAQLAVVVAWVAFSLSLFETTRPWTRQLGGALADPFVGVLRRAVGVVPVALVALTCIAGMLVVIRFVGLFFSGVARGETELGWLEARLARPTGTLIQVGIVVVAALIGGPLVLGTEVGLRAAVVLLAIVGLAAVPLAANSIVGLVNLYGERFPADAWVEVGGRTGCVIRVDSVEVVLRDGEGSLIRIPHLRTLVAPIVVHGPGMRVSVRTTLPPTVELEAVVSALDSAGRAVGEDVQIVPVRVDPTGMTLEVAARVASPSSSAELGRRVAAVATECWARVRAGERQ